MSKFEKILDKLFRGSSDSNFAFDDLILILKNLGFDFRVKGSHNIFYKEGIDEIINLQSKSGKAKPYQVRQVRNILLKYKIVGK
ncbi:MAG: type II toxin-antitoxin system HicA family toxin [Flammeovirgaceae bacterium]|jgi:predicted RNA binding protein YcfA (HicA-like mRNA interferase family)|nr:type II toxin-antitoxin system HicA family toxin [Flammeovirgaceae bacterium]